VTKRAAVRVLVLGGFAPLVAAALLTGCAPDEISTSGSPTASVQLGFSELPDGRGGINVESIVYTEEMGFDKTRSLTAFEDTVYPLLRANCAGCHSTENTTGSGAQAPLHSDVNVSLAHEYALTRVNFREPDNSKLVVRLGIDRHNCFRESLTCADAADTMLEAVSAWRDAVADMIPEVPRGVPASTPITEEQVVAWIEADKATVPATEKDFIKYASFHQMHNAGVSAQNLNHARVGLSKALNSTARWAPRIANPIDINGMGIVYRLDTRDYWGHTLIDTSAPDFALFYGGSDDDLAFAESKVDLNGKPISYGALAEMVHELKPAVTRDDKYASLVWARVLKGNAEGAAEGKSLPPNIEGFAGKRELGPHGQEIIDPATLVYAEAGQLTYTLTRPDVYNAIMALPGYSHELERELAVDKSRGMDSYDYMLSYEAITIDSRMLWRAETPEGYYWKTFDIFTQGEGAPERKYIDDAYRIGKVTYPFWGNPIPKFISNQGGTTPEDLSYVASLPLGGFSFDTDGTVGTYTGAEGPQQSAEEVIFSLPNGLQGYVLFGAWNQRRVDAFTLIVRDPRILRDVSDKDLDNLTGFGRAAGVTDHRLNTASSCIGCHIDGMNRINNNLRDWLDEEDGRRLPRGEGGVDEWIADAATVDRVRELYPPTADMRAKVENDRRLYLTAMAEIKQEMILGVDKNLYVEPGIWTIEWARDFYRYPVTRSN
jgi:hypothetical protein